MIPRSFFATVFLLLAASVAQAQSPGEIAFWESVRDSKNPAELQAYIDQYPNGNFVVLAKARLAALQKPAALPPQAAPQPRPAPSLALAPGVPHKLQAGDSWTYRLSYPRLRGQWGQTIRPPATHAVTLSTVAGGSIDDSVSVDGASPVSSSHSMEPELLVQGASIFSPYLLALKGDSIKGRLPSIAISEPGCTRGFICEAKGRVAGSEPVEVGAGKFLATKVIVDQEWRPRSIAGQAAGRFYGGRTLTIWYAPEIGRAVKYSSRATVTDYAPMEPNFDLELVSYQLK